MKRIFPQLQKQFIEVAFGKVPDNLILDGNTNSRVTVEYVNNPITTPGLASRAGEN